MIRREIVPTAKDINEAHKLAHQSAETAKEHACRCGEMLAKVKESLGRGGGFDEWVEKHCSFGRAMAYAYIKASKSPDTLSSAIRHLFPSGKPKGQKKQNVKSGNRLTPLDDSTTNSSEPTRDVSAPQAQKSNRAGVTFESAGESRAASASSDASHVDSDPEMPSEEEIAAADADFEREYQSSVAKVLEADDAIKAAHAEIKRQAAEIASLKVSRDGFMRGKHAVTQLLKTEQGKTSRLERKLKAAEDEIEKLRERISVMEEAA